MSDRISPGRRTVVWVRVLLEAFLLVAVALVVYYGFIRQQGPRHLKLALVTWTQDPFWEPLIRGAQEYADKSNVELIVIRSKPSVDEQTQHIRDLLASGIDGIAISPNDANTQREILDEAASKVPLVTFDTDAPESKRRRFVSIDNYAAGRICAGEMSEAMPDGGPVLISVGSVTMQHGRQRRQGVIDELLGRGFDRNRPADPMDVLLKGPKYTVVATATDGGDPEKAVESIAAALRAHPEVKGIVGLFSYSAPAALKAIKQVGRSDQLKIVGFDASDETQAALQAGTIYCSILQDSYRCGYETIEVLANEARGIAPGPAELSPILTIRVDVLTNENLAEFRNLGAVAQPSASSTTEPTGP